MSDSEILVKVEGVSKKFCRSLKRFLLYGVQDIAADLNPFARRRDNETTRRRDNKTSPVVSSQLSSGPGATGPVVP